MKFLSALLGKKPSEPSERNIAEMAWQAELGIRRFPLSSGTSQDPDRARRLRQLFLVSPATRDDAWIAMFWDAVWAAGLQVPEDGVFTGPDGFAYLRMNVPRADDESVVLQSIGDIAASLIDRWIGAAVFASPDAAPDRPEYVLSMGVLDSLLRFDDPAGEPAEIAEAHEPSDPSQVEISKVGHAERTVLRAEQQAMIGAPSEHYISKAAARALHNHLTSGWGLTDPRVALLVVPTLRPSRSLVIGKTVAQFAAEGVSEQLMAERVRMLTWYFPASRRLTLMPDDWQISDMTPLSQLM